MSSVSELLSHDMVDSIEALKVFPHQRREANLGSVPAVDFYGLIKAVLESAAIARGFHNNPSAPRYFLRVFTPGRSQTVEVLRHYAWVNSDWFYVPGNQLWRNLELAFTGSDTETGGMEI